MRTRDFDRHWNFLPACNCVEVGASYDVDSSANVDVYKLIGILGEAMSLLRWWNLEFYVSVSFVFFCFSFCS